MAVPSLKRIIDWCVDRTSQQKSVELPYMVFNNPMAKTPMFTGSREAVLAYCDGYCDGRQATYTFYIKSPRPNKEGICGFMVMFGKQYNNWDSNDD